MTNQWWMQERLGIGHGRKGDLLRQGSDCGRLKRAAAECRANRGHHYVFFFLFGIIVGSFLNVCITRIPEEISVVSPGVALPPCMTPIKPYDNVPVFGWGVVAWEMPGLRAPDLTDVSAH